MMPCRYLHRMAANAKHAGQEIFTIGFGIEGARCLRDTSGRFRNVFASSSLADAATDSSDDMPGGCSRNENLDGDHYLCQKSGGSLAPPFRRWPTPRLGLLLAVRVAEVAGRTPLRYAVSQPRDFAVAFHRASWLAHAEAP